MSDPAVEEAKKRFESLSTDQRSKLINMFLEQGTPTGRKRDLARVGKRLANPERVLARGKWPKGRDVVGVDAYPTSEVISRNLTMLQEQPKKDRVLTSWQKFIKAAKRIAEENNAKLDMKEVGAVWKDYKEQYVVSPDDTVENYYNLILLMD